MKRKGIGILLTLVLLCKPLEVRDVVGIGGAEKAKEFFIIPEDKKVTINVSIDNDLEINRIILSETSKEKLLEELMDVRLVDLSKPDIWPVVGVITSEYGWRNFMGNMEFHSGIDIAVPYGTPVSVTSNGKVIYTGELRGYGKTVIVYHGNGYVTLYAHLSDYVVNYGDKVVKGQIIGHVGLTGRTTGPHLHYEVIRYGVRQNPIAYLP